jgi:hypothetical protein
MAKLYYRGMAEQNDRPKIGRSARLLGVRPNIDINIQQMPRELQQCSKNMVLRIPAMLMNFKKRKKFPKMKKKV